MITGQVNENHEAIISIRLRGSRRQWNTVIDTGFQGAGLMMPSALIRMLGLRRRGEMVMLLADEQPKRFRRYVAEVAWHNGLKRVSVLESENEFLVSADLHAGSHVEIDMIPGGSVTITELTSS